MLARVGTPCCSRWVVASRPPRRAMAASTAHAEEVKELPKPAKIEAETPHHRGRWHPAGGIPMGTHASCATSAFRTGLHRLCRFGLASGVSPSRCWSTVEEVEEEEAMALYREYQEAFVEMKTIEDKKKAEQKARLAEVAKNEAAYPAILAKYEASLVTAEKEKDDKELQLEKRIREIQEYFGYWMDPKDPRFEVMLQQKEAEEKKAAKMAKRLEAQKKTLAAVSRVAIHPCCLKFRSPAQLS